MPAIDRRTDQVDARANRHAAALPDSGRSDLARVELRRDVWITALAAHLGIAREEGELQRRFAAHCRAEIKASKRAIRTAHRRHSWITHLLPPASTTPTPAAAAGHTVETMIGTWRSLRASGAV